jgi:hypothetical protein
MRHPASGRFVLIAALSGVVSGCSGQRPASPLSPSLLSSPASNNVRQSGASFAPRRADNDGDGYDDGDPPPEMTPPDPGTGPMPDPGTGPIPDPNQPPVDGVPPAPVQLTINVIGTFGSGAFAPNPLQAAIGNLLVWTNNDFVTHDIVFDDGTPVGNLAPGQSSMPIALITENASYHCTLHPSMVGQVVPIPPVVPTDPSQGPPADPNAPQPEAPPVYTPYDDGGGYSGYDDYYLKVRSSVTSR